MEMYITPVLIVGVIGLIAGLILAAAAKFMAVPVDERFNQLRAALPGANCGACGYAGCDAYANAFLEKEGVATNLCTPGGASVAMELSTILGVEFAAITPKYAIVHCNGTCANTDSKVDYKGPQTCKACSTFYNGKGICDNACLGYGDCKHVCAYGAVSIVDGVAVIDKDLCVACGMCVTACPKSIIDIVPATNLVYVSCSSTAKGAATRKACKVGCIGCKKCEKACPSAAITVTDNLARIDPEKCTNCEACVKECPTNAIRVYDCKLMVAPAAPAVEEAPKSEQAE